MEPNATLAEYDMERDGVTLVTTTQVPYYVHLKVAACLQIHGSAGAVIKPFLGGRLRRAHRVPELRDHRRAAGRTARARRCGCCRRARDLPRPPRPALDGGEDEDRPNVTAASPRSRWRPRRRRRLCRLRDHHHPLHRGADARHLRHPGHQARRRRASTNRRPAAHARPRHGGHARRLRGAAGPTWRPNWASMRWRCGRRTCCRRFRPHDACAERAPTACPSAWTEGEGGRLAGTSASAMMPRGRGLGWPVRTSCRAPPRPSTGPASRRHGAAAARLRRRRDALHRRRRHRPGLLEHHGRAVRRRGAGRRATIAHPRRLVGQRGDARDNGSYSRA